MLIKKVTVNESTNMWEASEAKDKKSTTTWYFLGIPFRKDTTICIETESGSEHWGK